MRNKLPLRSTKAGRIDKLLGFAGNHYIVTLGSVSLMCATKSTLPTFLNLNASLSSKIICSKGKIILKIISIKIFLGIRDGLKNQNRAETNQYIW